MVGEECTYKCGNEFGTSKGREAIKQRLRDQVASRVKSYLQKAKKTDRDILTGWRTKTGALRPEPGVLECSTDFKFPCRVGPTLRCGGCWGRKGTSCTRVTAWNHQCRSISCATAPPTRSTLLPERHRGSLPLLTCLCFLLNQASSMYVVSDGPWLGPWLQGCRHWTAVAGLLTMDRGCMVLSCFVSNPHRRSRYPKLLGCDTR